ncbi:MAG: outer membrane lipid asymmetry maintenance protein MlaD [Pseudomonadota bacterium]
MASWIENPTETIVGAVVLAAACDFAYFASVAGGATVGDAYPLKAQFSSATGVTVGTDVRVAGVKVGRVSALELDAITYRAEATLSVEKTVELPVDSLARITSESLLGGSFISLEPGAEDATLQPGDSFTLTQGAPDLLDLIQQFSGSPAAESDGS